MKVDINKNPIVGVIIGIITIFIGVAILFIPSVVLTDTMNCEANGTCKYTTLNIKKEIVNEKWFNINNITDIRKDTIKKDDHNRIYYDSRKELYGPSHRFKNTHHNSKKVHTTTLYDIYVRNNSGKIICVEISSLGMFNKFKSFYQNRKNGKIDLNTPFYSTQLNIFTILWSILPVLLGLICTILCIMKMGNKK